MLKSLFDKA